MESDWLGRAFNFDACEGRLSNGVRVSAAEVEEVGLHQMGEFLDRELSLQAGTSEVGKR